MYLTVNKESMIVRIENYKRKYVVYWKKLHINKKYV